MSCRSDNFSHFLNELIGKLAKTVHFEQRVLGAPLLQFTVQAVMFHSVGRLAVPADEDLGQYKTCRAWLCSVASPKTKRSSDNYTVTVCIR